MAGFALKNHQFCTAPVVQVLQPRFPNLRLLSYLVMNNVAGGLGEDTVRLALALGVDIVSFPTIDAVHHLVSRGKSPDAGVRISEESRLTAEARRVIELVADADRVIATGHSSPTESLLIIRHAASVGARRILFTHVTSGRISAPVELQREAAALGAVIEHAYESTRAHVDMPTQVATIADQIRAVGSRHCILTTDFGQVENPPFTEGLAMFASELVDAGVPVDDIRRMIVDQPSRLVDR